MEWQLERMPEGDEWACTVLTDEEVLVVVCPLVYRIPCSSADSDVPAQMNCIACVHEECTMLDLRVAELNAACPWLQRMLCESTCCY